MHVLVEELLLVQLQRGRDGERPRPVAVAPPSADLEVNSIELLKLFLKLFLKF